MASPKWARIQTEYLCPLRRGAWYRVVSALPLDVVVEVHHKEVRIPRQHLQLAERPGTTWTVIERAQASPRGPRSLGSRYAVCPNCRERVSLDGTPVNMRCRRCNGVFAVAGTGAVAATEAGAGAGSERKEGSTAAPTGSDDRRRRVSIPAMPRRRGPERRTTERRSQVIAVAEERRSGSDRRQGLDRRKTGARSDPASPPS